MIRVHSYLPILVRRTASMQGHQGCCCPGRETEDKENAAWQPSDKNGKGAEVEKRQLIDQRLMLKFITNMHMPSTKPNFS